jgi:predicted nucleotidyltransferase
MTEMQAIAEYPVPITETLLQGITQRIVENFDPEKVILFGSHVAGTAQADSDVDLLVIMETEHPPLERTIAVKKVCRPRFVPMDVLVKTPEEVAAQLARGNFFLRQILTEGRVLYERAA